MSHKIIIFGEINKKHLLPFLLAIGQIAYNTVNKYFPGEKDNTVLDLYSTSLGIMSVVFIPYIFHFANVENNTEKVKEIQKRKCLHYFLLIFIFIIYSIMKAVPQNMKEDYTKKAQKISNPFSEGPFANMGIELVLLTIVSIFLLKYKYHKHHVIAIITFILLGNICDGILGNYTKMLNYGLLINFLDFISIIADVVNYYNQKYMMEILFYPYWRICLALGIALFCFATMFLMYVLTNKDKEKSDIAMVSDFYLYFEEVHPGLIIGKQLLVMILYCITTTLSMLNIYYFNPNFILISFHLPKFIQILIEEDPDKYYSLIFFALQFISLMIYLEIIELNFCNLNENTKRNINNRGFLDMTGEDRRDSFVDGGYLDINKDYYINDFDDLNDKGPFIEMLQQNDIEKMSPSSVN